MHKRNHNRSVVRNLILAAGAAILVPASLAQAQTQNWTNASGGPATTGSNWSPAGVPTSTSALVYNLANTYTVNWSLSIPTVTSQTFKKGTVTLSGTANALGGDLFSVSGAYRVGDVSGDVAVNTITTGVFSCGSVAIGNAAGSTGTLNVNDSDADIRTTGAGDITVGAAGNGTLNLTSGGHAETADDFFIGSAGGDGTVSVSGLGTTPIRFSSILLTGVDGDLILGNALGSNGDLNISGGGIVTVNDDVFIGLVGGGVGTVDIGGASAGTLNVGDALGIGNNPTSTTAGVGALTVNSNGVVNVGGTIRLGDTTAGTGTLAMNGSSEVNCHSLVADPGSDLFLNGGHLTIDGGTFDPPTANLVLDAPGTILSLDNGATCGLSDATNALIVGNAQSAVFNLFNNSILTVSNGDIVFASGAGSAGTGQLSGVVTYPTDHAFILGKQGSASAVMNFGSLSGGSLQIGQQASGSGGLQVNNGSDVLVTALSIGGGLAGSGGSGSLTINAGGQVTVNSGIGSHTFIWPDGAMTLNAGGSFVTNGSIDVHGDFTMSDATLGAVAVLFSPQPAGATFNISGTVNAQAQMPVACTLALTGPLNVNSSGSAAMNSVAGSISVGNNTLTLTSIPSVPTVPIGNCSLGATGIINSNRPLSIAAGKTLSGDGTVNADISNSGLMSASGDGLTFGGIVSGIGQGMSGVRYTFASGGGFTGSGNINSKIVGQAGSKITITGASVWGDGSTGGFGTDGELDITGSLNMSDSNGVGLGSLTTLRTGSTLICNSAVNMTTTPTVDVLQGNGVVNSVVNCSGVIAPGFAGGDETGQINFIGNLSLLTGISQGRYKADIGGTAAADRDLIFINGAATLAGTLEVSLVNGFIPANGFATTIVLTNTPISGTFASEILPPRFHVEYDINEVRVVFCEADFNSDGFVDAIDYDTFINAWLALDPSADLNGDEFVDAIDYDTFIPGFLGGC